MLRALAGHHTESPSSDLSLIGSWQFSEGSGSIAYDSSGNGNDGTLVNSPARVFGAILLNAASLQYINLGTSLGKSQNFTLSMWINPNSYGNAGALFSRKYDGTPGTNYGIFCRSSATLEFTVSNETTSQSQKVNGPAWNSTNFPAGYWQHIAGTADGSTIKIFYNGAIYGSATQTVQNIGSDWGTSIGRHGAYPNYYFDGNVDDARYWNRALSESEINDIYISGRQ